MKRYAAIKLIFPSGMGLQHQVVEVDKKGRPLCCYPLSGEQHSTEWLPGVLLLSPLQLCTDDLKDWERVLEKNEYFHLCESGSIHSILYKFV